MKCAQINVDASTGKRSARNVELPCMSASQAAKADRARRSDEARTERNLRLAACDWTVLPDSAVDRDAWTAYRQALRDVPQQRGFPEVEWPAPPPKS